VSVIALDRNRDFASAGAHENVPGIPFHPFQGVYVVTCIDPRVDPALFLELKMGKAIVARDVGGRVTPHALRDLEYISHLVETKTPSGPWFEVAVIHHTDCGSGLLADPGLRSEYLVQRPGFRARVRRRYRATEDRRGRGCLMP